MHSLIQGFASTSPAFRNVKEIQTLLDTVIPNSNY